MTNAAATVTRDGQMLGTRSPTRAIRRSEASTIVAEELLTEREENPAAFSSWVLCYGDETNVDRDFYQKKGLFATAWNKPGELPRTQFDATVCCYTLNKLEREIRLDELERAIETVKPGGTLYAAFRSPARIATDARHGRWKRDGDGWRNNKGGFAAPVEWTEARDLLQAMGLQNVRVLKQMPCPIIAGEKPENWQRPSRLRWISVNP